MEILAFGTVWFWIIIILSSIIITSFTESDDRNFISNICFFITLGLLYWLGNDIFFKNVFSYIIGNPFKAITIIGLYFIIGTIWSIFKWFFYIKNIRDNIDIASSYDKSHFHIDHYKVSSNKDRIIHWMIYWPLSAIWTLINDPIKKIFNFMLTQFGGFYDKISISIFKDIIEEIDKDEKYKGKHKGLHGL